MRDPSAGWQTAGLILGFISIVPCCPVMLASVVVNIIALVKSSDGPAREGRWKPIVGLAITLIVGLGIAALGAIGAVGHD